MNALTILRTGAGSLPSPPVIDGFRTLGCRVVAADAESLSVGFTEADASVVIPLALDENFPTAILDLCREEQVDAIVPAVNEEIPRLIAIRDALTAAGTQLVAPSADAVDACLDKSRTAATLERIGLAGPRTVTPEQAQHLSFPMILKPRHGRGSRGVVRIDDEEELGFHLRRCNTPTVLQELLEGDEYTIDLFAAPDGELRLASVRRRLKVNAGISVAGEIVSSAPFLPYLERLTRELPLPGPSCVQCFLDGSGVPLFTDLNPRLGGGVALSLTGGTPILDAILATLRGECVERVVDAGVGLRFLRKYDEVYFDQSDTLRSRLHTV